jgi:hypothetical protein
MLCFALLVGGHFAELPSLSRHEAIGFALVFIMMFVADWFAISLSFGSSPAHLSVGAVAGFGCSLWFGPWLGMLAKAAVITAVGVHLDVAPRIAIENVASVSLAAASAAWIFEAIAGQDTTPLTSVAASIAAVVAAFVYAGVNFLTMVFGVAWDTKRPVPQLIRELSGGYQFLVSVPILGALIPIVGSVSLLGLLIVPLPLAVAHFAMQALSRLEHDTKAALTSLVDALELRDQYTSFHSLRVTLYTEALVRTAPNLSHAERQNILNAARLHDIGKVAVRDAVLLKPGPLTDEELVEMQSHAAAGAALVSQLESYRPLVDTIRGHHERWDGRGYPDRLSGENIPRGARLLCVADSFDAMTTDRPYRKALSYAQAIEELVKNKGKQFDPELVDCFVESLSHPRFEENRSSGSDLRAAAD